MEEIPKGNHVEVGHYPVDGKHSRFIELAGRAKGGPNALRVEVTWSDTGKPT